MLNEGQNKAVQSNSKRILCLAGAGTGKTKTLISRVERLISEGISPEEIICLTFTRSAGTEMKERLGEKADGIFINTFHSFCCMVIKENLEVFGLKEEYNIYDQIQREALLNKIIKDLKMEKEKIQIDDVVSCILGKEINIHSLEYQKSIKIAKEYRYRLRCENATDIDLLIYDVVNAFKNNKDIVEKYHNRYRYIFIDEFQDTNDSQMSFINYINPENLFLVGDDYQSIYGFNGSKVEYILNISKDKNYEVIKLERNYRSTKQIIKAANNLISYNASRTIKNLISEVEGEDVETLSFENSYEEIIKIINIIKERNRPFGDFCIITRTNKQINYVEYILKQNDIPFNTIGKKVPCLESLETKKLLYLVEFSKNQADDTLCSEFLNELMTDEEVESLGVKATDNDLSLYEGLLDEDLLPEFTDFIEECNIEEIWELPASSCITYMKDKDFLSDYNKKNIYELTEFIFLWEKVQKKYRMDYSMEAFITWFKTKTPMDVTNILKENNETGVNISTAHSSKGLEFPIVFIIGCNDGLFPHKKDDIQESRRLFYVAITRAKEKLYLMWEETSIEPWSKRTINNRASIFLEETLEGN